MAEYPCLRYAAARFECLYSNDYQVLTSCGLVGRISQATYVSNRNETPKANIWPFYSRCLNRIITGLVIFRLLYGSL